MVELLLAIVILAFGVLAIGSSIGYFLSAVRMGRISTERTIAVEEAVEGLRATAMRNYTGVTTRASTSPYTVGTYQLWWTVTDSTRFLKKVTMVVQGPGFTTGGAWSSTVQDTFRMSIRKP